jgi:uncharacterized membrane protein YfcA
MDSRRLFSLLLIGTAAGAFSGLFGVGGGVVIVPLLILLFAYPERLATGTSLAAILLIAAFAVITQSVYGQVDFDRGVILAAPAVVGVILGTAIQQRISERTVSLIFAFILVAVAIEMLVA